MLKKSERLTRQAFTQYFTAGKKHHFPHLTIVYTPHASVHASVVVGKKVAKQAVRRNTLRRRVYAQLYQRLKKEGITGVFIVLLKPSFATLPRKHANEEITRTIAAVIKRT